MFRIAGYYVRVGNLPKRKKKVAVTYFNTTFQKIKFIYLCMCVLILKHGDQEIMDILFHLLHALEAISRITIVIRIE